MEISTTANKQVSEILNKNTSPYFHRFTTYTRKAQGLTGRPQIQHKIQAHFTLVSFQFHYTKSELDCCSKQH